MRRRYKIVGLSDNDEKVVNLDEKSLSEKTGNEKELSFKVYWSDQVFTNPKLINYYKIYLRELIDMNKLLGKFDNEGNYSISVEIKRELVRMYKEVSDMGEGFYLAKAEYMDKEFDFSVEINLLDDGNAQADLYLNEKVSGAHEITFKTFIASFVDKLDGSFNLRVKRAFKLVDYMPVLHDTQIPNIAILLQGQIDNGIFLDELIELGSQKYVLRMLEELESCGDMGRDILDMFKERMHELDEEDENKGEESEEDKLSYKHKVNKKFTKMRRLLDEIVDEKGGYKNLPIEKDKLNELLDDFNSPVEKVEKLRESYQTAGAGNKSSSQRGQVAPRGKGRTRTAGTQNGTSTSRRSTKNSSTKDNKTKATNSRSTTAKDQSNESSSESCVGSYESLYDDERFSTEGGKNLGNGEKEKNQDVLTEKSSKKSEKRRRVNISDVEFKDDKDVKVTTTEANKTDNAVDVTDVEKVEKQNEYIKKNNERVRVDIEDTI